MITEKTLRTLILDAD